MKALTRAQIQRIDRLAIDELGLPGVVLMENAGRSVAQVVLAELRRMARPMSENRVAVFCGGGNNGGDGYVAARHLFNAGVRVEIFAASDPRALAGDAAIHRTVAEKMGLPVCDFFTPEHLRAQSGRLQGVHVIVDALLGTGFGGELRPHMAAVIRICNECAENGAVIVAVDVPSGLDCETGQPASQTIRAAVTVTLAAVKTGFLRDSARSCLGRVLVGDIGTPPQLIDYAAAGK